MEKATIEIGKEHFGPLWPLIEDETVTDIDYNGKELWITRTDRERICMDPEFTRTQLTSAFIEQFSTRTANLVSRQFHKRNPELEAETPELRITILHESVARNGRSISIRKTPPVIRMEEEKLLQEGFCSRQTLLLLKSCVRAGMNMTFCGMPGVGKTECLKFFSHFISPEERVITIEDTLEIRYPETNPGKDCIEMKVVPELFDYGDAIKASLRLNPRWIMLSEARSREVRYLLESWSTGVRGMTTLHTDDVRNVPDRIRNMMDTRAETGRLENEIYQALDLGLLISCRTDPKGKKRRYLDQVCFYLRRQNRNEVCMVVENGEWVLQELPEEISRRFCRAGISESWNFPGEEVPA